MTLIHIFDEYLDEDATVMLSKCGEDDKSDAKIRYPDDFKYFVKNGTPPNHELCDACSSDFDMSDKETQESFVLFRKPLSRQKLRQGEDPTTIHIANSEKSDDTIFQSLCGYKLMRKLSENFDNLDYASYKENEERCKRCEQLYEK